MLKKLWSWLFPALQAIEPPTPELPPKIHNGLFSTDIDDGFLTAKERAKLTAQKLQNYFQMLQTMAPATVADGATMDSDDNANSIKGAYQYAQPNLSSTVVNYFLAQTFIGHQLASMLAQHWLIHKACYMPARDCMKNGFEICSVFGDEMDSPKVLKYMELLDKKYKLKRHCVNIVGKSRIFGIRIAFFKVESTDPMYYEKPFNIDGVMPNSYKGVVQVDPYWCSPMLDNAASSKPDSLNFYEPTWWQINGTRYHRSHLFIMREAEVTDVLKPAYIYGGIPLPQRIVERVYCAERTANEAPQLAMTKRTTIYKTDIAELIAAGPQAFQALDYAAEVQNNYGRNIIGLDDELSQVDTSLTDLDEVIMTQYQVVAAIANCPATKLLGTSPKGFGASGDYEVESYNESLNGYNEDLTPFIERHHALCMRSDVMPNIQQIDPDFREIETTINWRPLDTITAKEQSEIDLNKSTTALNLVNTGGIDGYDVRNVVRNDKESPFHGIPEAERPDVQPVTPPANNEPGAGNDGQ